MPTESIREPVATVFVGIGSNLDHPLEQVTRAWQTLLNHPALDQVVRSPWYQSRAVGPGQQPDYINGVIKAECFLSPLELLDALQRIENNHQRRRSVRWGPRTLDLDILLFGQITHRCDRLEIPHPSIADRNFVVYPLFDIAPELALPNGTAIASLWREIGGNGLTKLRPLE